MFVTHIPATGNSPRPAQSDALRQKLGMKPKAKLPTHGIPSTYLRALTENETDAFPREVFVEVWVEPAKEGVVFRRGGGKHRIMSRCPHCKAVVPAGRLMQHRCG